MTQHYHAPTEKRELALRTLRPLRFKLLWLVNRKVRQDREEDRYGRDCLMHGLADSLSTDN